MSVLGFVFLVARGTARRAAGQFAIAVAALAGLGAMASSAAAQDSSPFELFLKGLEFRSIGPAAMGGRVADFAVDEADPSTFYVGTATGGLWKTTNHGASFEPLFDDQPTGSIGDVTLAPSNPEIVWVT
jgi:hypothetical protein